MWVFRSVTKVLISAINPGMKIAIIGGGAAGLMCAATLAEADIQAELFLLEKNNGLGKKVLISGGGRCNVTTGLLDVRTVLTKYPRGAKFLQKAMYQFPPQAVYDWFEEHGVPLKTEADLRVFPKSDNGADIVGVFESIFRKKKLTILTGHQLVGAEKTDKGFLLKLKDRAAMEVDIVVFTTGGQAYRQTGSTGDGYNFAETLGHSITPLAPSLNAFITEETWPKELAGVSSQRARVTSGRNAKHTAIGPILFTHKGITGPAVFVLSSQVAFEQYDPKNPLLVTVDLFPDISEEDFIDRILNHAHQHGKKTLMNVLALFIPRSIIETCVSQLKIATDGQAAELTKIQAKAITAWLKGIPLHAISRAAGDEFVTAGGVDTSEIDPSTMESKISPGLYFAGEIMDIDGYTGGFNLQASWATGRLAAMGVLGRI